MPQLHLSQTWSRVEESDHAVSRAASGNHTKHFYLYCIGPNICPCVAFGDMRKQSFELVAKRIEENWIAITKEKREVTGL